MRWSADAQGLLCLPQTEKTSIIQVYEEGEPVMVTHEGGEHNNKNQSPNGTRQAL